LEFQPQIPIDQACHTSGELVSVTGTVVRVEPINLSVKMTCYRCSTCGSELVVKNKQKSTKYTQPSTCQKGCKARGNFIALLSSPFTICQPKQMVRIQESSCVVNKEFRTLDVQLIQNQVGTIIPGQVISVAGVLKHQSEKSNKFMKGSKFLKYYLKCFSLEIINKCLMPKREGMTQENDEIISMVKAEPSPFRLLVHSLAPLIFGREEVKAGLLLSLLSGRDLLEERRSESHILLVGNPGTGKSKLLQFCADVSTNGISVTGPTLTSVGLCAKIGKNGTIDAGALILANGGVCCIDEFDKMGSHSQSLLEAMEQQSVSISKSCTSINAPAKVVIIAAANPVSSFYDHSKTLLENIKIKTPLMSRFDLIFPISNYSRASDAEFMDYMSTRENLNESSTSKSFFKSNPTPVEQMRKERPGLNWLRLRSGERLETLPIEILQLVIAFARENIKPEISDEAARELKNFFLQLRSLSTGNETQTVTFRQLEGLKRLTLARARADLSEIATRDHALDVINLFKFTMIDVFAVDQSAEDACLEIAAKKPKTQNVSSLSKPKQLKAFLERWRDEVEAKGRNLFTHTEIKEMAKELGIRDYSEIVYRLNMDGFILQKLGGYEILDE
jgi:DNA helicase MCM8